MAESIHRTESALLALEALGYDRQIAVDLAGRTILTIAESAEALRPMCAYGVEAVRACALVEQLAARVAAIGYPADRVAAMAHTMVDIALGQVIIDGATRVEPPVGILRA